MTIRELHAKAMKQEPSALAIKFYPGAKSRIWWKIEDAGKPLSRSSTSYSTEEKAHAVWEKVREWGSSRSRPIWS